MSKDYYQILGISKNVSQEEIKQAFRKLAHQYHPDKAGGSEAKFKEINEAYQVLSNPEKRQKYDQFGASFEEMGGWGGASWEDIMQAFRQGAGRGSRAGTGPFSGFSFSFGDLGLGDILSDFFGGEDITSSFGSSGRGRVSRGRDTEVFLDLDFKDAVFGIEQVIEVRRREKCSRCHGNMAEPGTSIVSCKTCGGQGQVAQTRSTIFGTMRQVITCPACKGEGKLPKQNCLECKGEGTERVSKTLKVKIPAGIADGEAIRIPKEGNISDNLRTYGDLYVRVRVREHYRLKREGDDICSDELITFTQAVLGDKIRVETIDGKVDLKIPSGTASGTVFKLKKKGVPHLRSAGRGDHYVKVKIVVPREVSHKAKKLLEGLREEGL
jgi:molecular chaperone DnaJ